MSGSGSIDVRVTKKTNIGADIISLELVALDGSDLPKFDAGAHIDVKVSDVITRQYSLCNDPAVRSAYRLGILKDPSSRGGSSELHETTAVGDQLTISEPRNLFPLDSNADHCLLVGGGIGITPMIAMAHELFAAGRNFDLHYCVTDPSKAAFADELRNAPFSDKVHVHFDTSADMPAFQPEKDMLESQPGHHIYTCGPTGFMDWILKSALERGFTADQYHKEDFGADVDLSGKAFIVEARKSGKVIEVADGETIANALTDAGITVDVSCEEGVCGTCLTDVIEGEVDHRDQYLNDEEREEGEMILVCCSRAKSAKLVLDI